MRAAARDVTASQRGKDRDGGIHAGKDVGIGGSGDSGFVINQSFLPDPNAGDVGDGV
jgi:hypothetical protein